MNRSRLLSTASVLALSAAALMAQRAAADGQQDPQRPPVFRTEANFVRVDAYPTSDGKPVLDLKVEDFEVYEDGVKQAVQTFEHVIVRPAGPLDVRREPNSVRESLEMAANPRNRVFVLFLDKKFVRVANSWNIRAALVRLLDRLLAPDDLIGIMTSDMAASDVVLARKTTILADNLMSYWPWGERDQKATQDDREVMYDVCFPLEPGVVGEMIGRRRERMTMESLDELVRYLRTIREERKAILTVSEGWLLFKPNQGLTTARNTELPGTPKTLGTGPDGRITTNRDAAANSNVDKRECWADRQRLANIDDDQYFKDLIGEANRGNASFYTVDPRGLAVFETPINAGVPIAVDRAILRARQDTLHRLAEETDGIAMMDTNDYDASLKRMTDDLSSYYLLGYYSTNPKPDGLFRKISVKAKRSGVLVRARRGYRAATEAEVAARKAGAAPPAPTGAAAALISALGTLDRVRPGIRFYVAAAPVAPEGSKAISAVWVTGELVTSGPTDPWLKGGTADVEIRGPGRAATAQATLAPGDRGFAIAVPLPDPIEAGTLSVRVRLAGADPAADRSSDSVSLDVESAIGRPLAFRRGGTTGNRWQPAATLHFTRADRVRLDLPVGAATKPVSARLLDRTGQPVNLPVTIGERVDPQTSQRWLTADVSITSLTPGDYGVEMTTTAGTTEQRVLTAIRVTR